MRNFSGEIKRIVVKVGSSSITHKNGKINIEKIQDLAMELSNLADNSYEVVLVTSGAVATGTQCMNLEKRPDTTAGKQATAAVGQVDLIDKYSLAFNRGGYHIGQILVTNDIIHDQVMNTNVTNTFEELFNMGVIPVVNENDTISTYEIQFGDNDTLSATVAEIIEADLLILLSDVDGFYTDEPSKPGAKLIKEVDELTDEILSYAQDAGSDFGTGGMKTKLNAASICMKAGIDMVLTDSSDMSVIKKIIKAEDIGTLFKGGKNA